MISVSKERGNVERTEKENIEIEGGGKEVETEAAEWRAEKGVEKDDGSRTKRIIVEKINEEG
jgi:hypothetical protein